MILKVTAAYLALLMFACQPAQSNPPPPGTQDYDLLHPFAGWISTVTNKANEKCCDIGDGTVVLQRDGPDGIEIRFLAFDRFPTAPRGWVKVPPEAVVYERNMASVSIAWWYGEKVRCFLGVNRT